jgi:hypothetical protein
MRGAVRLILGVWAAMLSFALFASGVVAIAIGVALLVGISATTPGTPWGWAVIAAGPVLTSLGIVALDRSFDWAFK